MKTLSWNIRGLGRPEKRRKVKEAIKDRKVDMVLLQEIKKANLTAATTGTSSTTRKGSIGHETFCDVAILYLTRAPGRHNPNSTSVGRGSQTICSSGGSDFPRVLPPASRGKQVVVLDLLDFPIKCNVDITSQSA
ncbi:hypothetical protein CsSME_00032746 [Camellia sinensis var. sinensis]